MNKAPPAYNCISCKTTEASFCYNPMRDNKILAKLFFGKSADSCLHAERVRRHFIIGDKDNYAQLQERMITDAIPRQYTNDLPF